MSQARAKTWIKEILTFADLNAEFDNILDNALSVISPITGTLDMNGEELNLGSDSDTSIHSSSDDIIDFKAKSFDVLKVDGTTASSQNGITVESTATGVDPIIAAHGEADMGIEFHNDQGEELLVLATTPTAVNEITITNDASGSNPTIAATSDTDTDIGINFENDQAEEMLVLASVAGGINHITIGNSATTNNPTIACTGDESDIGITLQNQDGEPMLILDSVASSVNEVTITSAAAGGNPSIAATGTDGDADLLIDADGVGNVTIGNVSTGAVELGNAQVQFPNSDGTAGQMLVTDGSAALTFQNAMPRSYLAGLGMSNGTDDEHDIDIAVGECKNDASVNDTNIVVSTALGKQIDVIANTGGTVGVPTGGFPSGLDAGAVQVDTEYKVFLITDGTNVTAGFDESATAANLIADHTGSGGGDLSGYTKYRRIGSVFTGDPANIYAFNQYGDTFLWDPIKDIDHVIGDANQDVVDLTYVPNGINVEAIINFYAKDAADIVGHAAYGDLTDVGAVTTTGTVTFAANRASGDRAVSSQLRLMTDTSRQIWTRFTAAIDTANIGLVGYKDRRGRDD